MELCFACSEISSCRVCQAYIHKEILPCGLYDAKNKGVCAQLLGECDFLARNKIWDQYDKTGAEETNARKKQLVRGSICLNVKKVIPELYRRDCASPKYSTKNGY